MRKTIQFLFVALLMLGLTACSESEVEITPTSGISMDEIHTAVILTLTEQAVGFTPTPEPTTTITPTILDSPTPSPTVTIIATLPLISAGGSYSTANGCNDSAYVSDVTIPDGTVLAAGEAFTKTWQLSNTGTCDWSTSYQLTFISGDDMDADDVSLGEVVYAGYTNSISVDMVAPSTNGTYYSYWKMVDASGNLFGGTVYAMIVVSDASSTSTPTVTATGNTSTSTSTPAASATSTATPVVSSSSTTVPSNTPVPVTATTVPSETSVP